MASARSFISLAFSPSSPLSRFAPGTSSPPYLAYREGRLADPVLPAQVGRLHPGLVLLQDRDDLLFRMPWRFIVWSSLQGQTPIQPGYKRRGNVNPGAMKDLAALVPGLRYDVCDRRFPRRDVRALRAGILRPCRGARLHQGPGVRGTGQSRHHPHGAGARGHRTSFPPVGVQVFIVRFLVLFGIVWSRQKGLVNVWRMIISLLAIGTICARGEAGADFRPRAAKFF
jgi:hypothetical protein